MLIKIIPSLILLFFSFNSWAQMSPVIQSARPGQAIGPGVVGSGTFQIQMGHDLLSEKGSSETTTSLINSVLRLGITKDFEISAVVNRQEDTIKTTGSTQNRTGISVFQLGFRSRIIDHSDGLIPALAIQTRFKTDAVSNAYRSNDLAPVIIIAAAHSLCDQLSHTLNLGSAHDGNTASPTYFWRSNFSHPINDHWGTFLEAYGNVKNDIGTFYGDTGFEYFMNNDLKLDLSAGYGHNNGNKETFVSVGFSWRTGLFSPLELNQ
jgi:hypothetical protein